MVARYHERIGRLLVDPDWLDAKLHVTDIPSILSDYGSVPATHVARIMESALRLSARALTADPEQLRTQLCGRLISQSHPQIVQFLERAGGFTARPWLRPLSPCLSEPGEPLVNIFAQSEVNAVRFTPDGQRIVAGLRDGRLQVWNLVTNQLETDIQADRQSILSIAVTQDGRRVVSGSSGGRLRLWDRESNRLCAQQATKRRSRSLAIFFTPGDSHIVAVCATGSGGGLDVWYVGQGAGSIVGSTDAVRTPAVLTPDGKHVVGRMTRTAPRARRGAPRSGVA